MTNFERYASLFSLVGVMEKWLDDPLSSLTVKDRTKVKTIYDQGIQIFKNYKSIYGQQPFDNLCKFIDNNKIAILPKDEDLELVPYADKELYVNMLNKVLEKSEFDCSLCDGKNFKNCEWYAVHRLTENRKGCDKYCPYIQNLDLEELNEV